MPKDIKYIDIKEFRELGILQELNRLFLHPLGLALEVAIEDDGTEKLGRIWDYREDDEGIKYGAVAFNNLQFKEKAERFRKMRAERFRKRFKELGYIIQPFEYCYICGYPRVRIKDNLWLCPGMQGSPMHRFGLNGVEDTPEASDIRFETFLKEAGCTLKEYHEAGRKDAERRKREESEFLTSKKERD